jgi:transcription initiation factor TFIIH subunit 2
VSVVGIGAEIFLLQNVCEETGGTYKVAITAQNLQTLVLSHTKPAAVPDENKDGTKVVHKPATGMWVGFPVRRQLPLPGWRCPRCSSLHQDLPVDCTLCGLKLLSSSHRERSTLIIAGHDVVGL